MKKALAVLGVVLLGTAILYAQEPQRFTRGIQLVRGNLGVGAGSIVFEGATGDANELTVSAPDVDSDVTLTIGDTSVSWSQGATPADALDTIFFVADRAYTITDVDVVWGTAESTGSMDVDVEKLTGTEACASGTDVISAVVDATGTANTVASATLSSTASELDLAAGDRLCVDLTATPNEVANLVVTVGLQVN